MMEALKSELDQTIDILERMTDEELQAVRSVAMIIMSKKPIESPFRQLTEEEFCSHVDEGLAELDTGLGEDSDVVDAEIAAGLKVSVDPFYSEENMRYLKKVMSDIDSGRAGFVEHELIED